MRDEPRLSSTNESGPDCCYCRSPAQWSLLTLLAVDKTNERLLETLRKVFTSVLSLEPRIRLEQLNTVLGWQTTNGANIHFPPGRKYLW